MLLGIALKIAFENYQFSFVIKYMIFNRIVITKQAKQMPVKFWVIGIADILHEN